MNYSNAAILSLGRFITKFNLFHFLVLFSLLQSQLFIDSKGMSDYSNSRYDKSVNLFSPDGNLLQVNYANIAAERGASLLCLPTSEGGFIICSLNSEDSDLIDKRAVDKITRIDSTTWIGFAGFAGDGRCIIRNARQFCTEFKLKFGCSPKAIAIAKHIGEIQHKSSYSGVERPLGVHTILFDVGEENESPQLFSIPPSGSISCLKAAGIGMSSEFIMKQLESRISSASSLLPYYKTISLGVEILAELYDKKKFDEDTGKSYDIHYIRKLPNNSILKCTSTCIKGEDYEKLSWI